MAIKKVLVTGDRGYIGSSLVPLLLKSKYSVVGFDTNYFTKSLLTEKRSKYKKITKDIRKVDKKDLEGIDAVIHLAGLSNDPMGEINPNLTEDINHKSSIRLAEIAKSLGVSRFLFSSSCSIYGIVKKGTADENSKINPVTKYAVSKIKVESDLKKLADNSFCVGLLRNSTVYGYSPNFRGDLVVNDLIVSAIIEKEINVLSDGSMWRPLIDVRDLSNIFVEFLKVKSKIINGEVINVGFWENNLQVKEIAEIISKHLPYQIIYHPELGRDSRSYKVSFKKFEKTFPSIKQEWVLDKSIKDLSKRIENVKRFNKNDFIRIRVLLKLIKDGKIDKNMYWKI